MNKFINNLIKEELSEIKNINYEQIIKNKIKESLEKELNYEICDFDEEIQYLTEASDGTEFYKKLANVVKTGTNRNLRFEIQYPVEMKNNKVTVTYNDRIKIDQNKFEEYLKPVVEQLKTSNEISKEIAEKLYWYINN